MQSVISVIVFVLLAVLLLLYIGFIAIKTRIVTREDDITSALSQLGLHMESFSETLFKLLDCVSLYSPEDGEKLKKELLSNNKKITGESSEREVIQLAKVFDSVYGDSVVMALDNTNISEDQTYAVLKENLNRISNMVKVSTKIYNSAVLKYNSEIGGFPTCIVAYMFGKKALTPIRSDVFMCFQID